jgi:hypothetical protein
MTRYHVNTSVFMNQDSTYGTNLVFIPGRLALAFVYNVGAAGPPEATPTLSSVGKPWTRVLTFDFAPARGRLTCFRLVLESPLPSGPTLIDFAGVVQTGIAWSIFEYDGVNVFGPNGAGGVVQARSTETGAATATSLAVPLTPFGDKVRNVAVGGILVNAQTAVTQGGGFAPIDHTETPLLRVLATEDRVGEDLTVDWSWPQPATAGAIALELRAVIPPLELVRRFEPILYFHPGERFFPSDAKRYLEHCALWAAEVPFDKKDSWGGKGQPFDRVPLIGRGKIAATPPERRPGDTYLNDSPTLLKDDQGNERFLELAGWKDKAGVAQPGVTAASANTYANRQPVADAYDTDPDLRGSRFWYHAELFDTTRLERLLRDQASRAPDFSKVFAALKNPALVCYYFFFPGHEEPLAAPCDAQVEGKELACFGGEWACMALLLERDDPLAHYTTPSWIGHTGRRLPDLEIGPGVSVPVPQAFDPERRSNMKVTRWRPGTGAFGALPDVLGDHPKLFVSSGTHSLYLDPGPHVVDPYPADVTPQSCGVFDTPQAQQEYVDAHPHEDPDGNALIALAKTLLGLILGGAYGAIAGAYWAHLEGNEFGQGIGPGTGLSPGPGSRRGARPRPARQSRPPGRRDHLRPRRPAAALGGRPGRHDRLPALRPPRRAGEPGVVAPRWLLQLSRPLGAPSGGRPRRAPGGDAVPTLLADVLRRVREGQGYAGPLERLAEAR